MSKIAEQKALEAYPEDYAYVKCDNEETNYTEIDDEGTKWLKVDSNKEFRTVYKKCYDQAMQDFLEWLKSYRQEASDKTGYIAGIVNDETIEQFKNYMENEIQD